MLQHPEELEGSLLQSEVLEAPCLGMPWEHAQDTEILKCQELPGKRSRIQPGIGLVSTCPLGSCLTFRESQKTEVSKKLSVYAELPFYKESAIGTNVCSYEWSLLALKFYELVKKNMITTVTVLRDFSLCSAWPFLELWSIIQSKQVSNTWAAQSAFLH